jgi:hypothetical protein
MEAGVATLAVAAGFLGGAVLRDAAIYALA